MWQSFLTTFATVFVAEMGDKTQLATFGFAAGSHSRWMVFAGAAVALICTSALGVLAGTLVGKYVSPAMIRYGSGFLFILIGLFTLLKR